MAAEVGEQLEPDEAALMLACVAGDIDRVRELIEVRGVSARAANRVGNTPMHVGLQAGGAALVRLLMWNGASAMAVNNLKQCPLGLAVEKGMVDAVRVMVELTGPRLVVDTRFLWLQVLHIACRQKGLEMARVLVDTGYDARCVWVPTYELRGLEEADRLTAFLASRGIKQTPRAPPYLSVATTAAGGNVGEVVRLLEKGGSVVMDDGRNAVFGVPPGQRGVDVVRALAQAGMSLNIQDNHGCSPLQRMATREGMGDVVREMISQGACPEAQGPLDPPIIRATMSGHLDNLSALIAGGANVNARSVQERCTALDCICRSAMWRSTRRDPEWEKAFKMASMLLEAGAQAEVKDVAGETPLRHLAVALPIGSEAGLRQAQMLDLLKLLCERGARVDTVARHANGKTVLHLAVEHGVKAAVEVVASRPECDINAKNEFGHTSVFTACTRQGKVDVLKTLIALGGDVNSPCGMGTPPLHETCRFSGSAGVEKVTLLVEGGARLDATDAKGRGVLHVAEAYPLMEELLRLGCDPSQRDEDGRSPLHGIGLSINHTRLLLAHNADPSASCRHGTTPLHSAAVRGDWASLALLLSAGAPIDPPTEHGVTPLMMANGKKVVKKLVAAGADVNHRSMESGMTPLLCASLSSCTDTLSALLAVKAEVNAVDKTGNTPMHFAARRGSHKALEFLISAGGDVNSTNQQGRSPLHEACEPNRASSGRRAALSVLLRARDMHTADTPDSFGWRPLQVLLKAVDLSENPSSLLAMVTEIGSGGCDVVTPDPEGFTPLERAVEHHSNDLTSALVSFGAAKNGGGEAALAAALKKDIRLVKIIAKGGASVDHNTLNVCSVCYFGIIHKYLMSTRVVLAAHTAVVRTILRFGAEMRNDGCVEGWGWAPAQPCVCGMCSRGM